MGWNYLSIPKLQPCSRWSLGMDKSFHPILYNGHNYLSMFGIKLNLVSKRGHWSPVITVMACWRPISADQEVLWLLRVWGTATNKTHKRVDRLSIELLISNFICFQCLPGTLRSATGATSKASIRNNMSEILEKVNPWIKGQMIYPCLSCFYQMGLLLLAWINFNPSMDK